MTSLQDISVNRIDGAGASLADYQGKVLLIVNVASKCGLTPQYEGLESLYRRRREEGLEVLAFPANDFNGQEPGENQEIASFCAATYDVSFPLFAKISVKGDTAHPLYRELTTAEPEAVGDGPMREKLKGYGISVGAPGDVLWNFEKFLIDRDGRVAARFAPDVTADDPRLLAKVDELLEST